MKKTCAVLLSVGIGASSLAGCFSSQHGRRIDTARVSEIRKGQTTRQEIIRMFGAPQTTQRDASGAEALIYGYSSMKGKSSPLVFIPIIGLFFLTKGSGEVRATSLIVKIKDNVVQDYTISESASTNN